jgi:hypothetical protein
MSEQVALRIEEQWRHQDRLDRRRMTWWIPWLFVLGLLVSVVGLYAYVVSIRLGDPVTLGAGLFAASALYFGLFVGAWLC